MDLDYGWHTEPLCMSCSGRTLSLWISSKSWLQKCRRKTKIWIVGFVGCSYLFLVRALCISFEEQIQLQIFWQLTYEQMRSTNGSVDVVLYLSICRTVLVALIAGIIVLCCWCLCGSRVYLQVLEYMHEKSRLLCWNNRWQKR